MKKAISLIIAFAVMLGLLTLPAFADGEEEKLIETANFIVYNEQFPLAWVDSVINDLDPEYVYDDAAYAPTEIIKEAFYKATSAPKGYWEKQIEKDISENLSGDYETGKGTIKLGINDGKCGIQSLPIGGFSNYGYADKCEKNDDGTYSLYFAAVDYDEEGNEVLTDSGIIIKLKPADDGIEYVSKEEYGDNSTTPDSGSENEVPSSGGNNSSSKPASENPNTADSSSAAAFAIIGVAVAALCISAKKAKAFR